jgi:hypothetical protein
MQKVEEYLKHAAECRELAQAGSPICRKQLESMAMTWEQLAENRKRRLLKQPILADD